MSRLEGLELVAKCVCETCGGGGSKPADGWDDYRRWASGRTAPSPEEYFVDVRGWDAVPPTSVACGDCDGGVRTVSVSLPELEGWLRARAPEPLITTAELRQSADEVKAMLTGAAMSTRGLGVAQPDQALDAMRLVQEAAVTLEALARLGSAAIR